MTAQVIAIDDIKTDAIGRAIVCAMRRYSGGWIDYDALLTSARKYLDSDEPKKAKAIDDTEFKTKAGNVLSALESHWYAGRQGRLYMWLMPETETNRI